jgi:PhzF family phenazine biosynthesis protein
MRKFPFVTVDVLSSRALEGNPVAVFTDARGLSDAEMQAIALETRLSETTSIIPRDEATERADGVMVRIFTVAEELPFAGHPTLGTASVLAHARQVTEVALDQGWKNSGQFQNRARRALRRDDTARSRIRQDSRCERDRESDRHPAL